MLSLLLAAVAPASLPSVAITPKAPGDRPPVRIWINSDRTFRPGQEVKVEVETGLGGHLLVMQYDNDGTLRVLFPLAPGEDTWVEPDRRYALRNQFEDASFVAQGDGPGLIYTALSNVPWQLGGFVGADGRWNYEALSVPRDIEDAETGLTDLVQRMAGPGGFDYDVLDYLVVSSNVTIVTGRPGPSYWYPVWVDPYAVYLLPDCWDCRGWGSRFYFSFGYGPTWYWPSYWYRPWHYSYYGYNPYYPPYWGYRPGYGYRPVVTVPRDGSRVVGRPRGYDIERTRPRPPGTNDRAGRPSVPQAERDGQARPGTGQARPRARGTERPDPPRASEQPRRVEPEARPTERSRSRGGSEDGRRLDRPESLTRPMSERPPPVQVGGTRSTESTASRARPARTFPAVPDRPTVTRSSEARRATASTASDRSRSVARGPSRPVARRVERPSSGSQQFFGGRSSSGSSAGRVVRGSSGSSGRAPSVSRSPAPSRPSVSRSTGSSGGRSVGSSSGSSSSGRSRGSSGSSRPRKP